MLLLFVDFLVTRLVIVPKMYFSPFTDFPYGSKALRVAGSPRIPAFRPSRQKATLVLISLSTGASLGVGTRFFFGFLAFFGGASSLEHLHLRVVILHSDLWGGVLAIQLLTGCWLVGC